MVANELLESRILQVNIPVVSICLPNLNTRPFLEERMESILRQTFADWELIIVDDYSTDGAWELFQKYAQLDSRIKLFRGPKLGLYPGWNAAIERATGDFVYIATSDDTMSSRCLETLVGLLDKHPSAGLAQCALEIIDEHGAPLPVSQQWENYTLGQYNINFVSQPNFRIAPHDGLIHPFLFTICTSVNQLLVRRKVFETLGLFEGKWGPIGDFEWHMRVALVEDCVFTPEKLATWRVHKNQATDHIQTFHTRLKMIEMSRFAFAKAMKLKPDVLSKLDFEKFIQPLYLDVIEMRLQSTRSRVKKLAILAQQLKQNPKSVLKWLKLRLFGQPWYFWNCDPRYNELDLLIRKYGIVQPQLYRV
jgi:glycosyltransferase involved in cell wall biosynthesis